jgi:hypothetical protein
MSKAVPALFLALLAAALPMTAVAAQGVEFSGLAHKVLAGPDQDVEVFVRAVDKEDFEVFDVRLRGRVKAGQTRVLSDTQFIGEKLFKSIVRWEVEE